MHALYPELALAVLYSSSLISVRFAWWTIFRSHRFDVHSFELDYLGEVCEHNHRVETDRDTTDGGVDDMSVPDDLNFKF